MTSIFRKMFVICIIFVRCIHSTAILPSTMPTRVPSNPTLLPSSFLPSAVPTLVPSHAQPVGTNDSDTWLREHNIRRCIHDVPLVTWSDAAYQSAQAYVNNLATLQHSNSYQEPPPAGPAGENLAIGFPNISSVVAAWYDEISCCVAIPGCVNQTCSADQFTAIVWEGVQEIGCAHNSVTNIFICRYRSGNVLSGDTANTVGFYLDNVLPISKNQSQCEGDIILKYQFLHARLCFHSISLAKN